MVQEPELPSEASEAEWEEALKELQLDPELAATLLRARRPLQRLLSPIQEKVLSQLRTSETDVELAVAKGLLSAVDGIWYEYNRIVKVLQEVGYDEYYGE